MGQAAWPTDANVVSALARAGYTAAATEAGLAIAAARDEFERRAGRIILPAAARERRYDPPVGPWLDLGLDLQALTTIYYSPQGGSSQLLVANVDFWLEPYSAIGDTEPVNGSFQGVRFKRRWRHPLAGPDHRSIAITATWGMSTVVPDDIWFATLYKAVALLLPETHLTLSTGRVSRSEAGVQTVWGGAPSNAISQASANFEAAIARYARPIL